MEWGGGQCFSRDMGGSFSPAKSRLGSNAVCILKMDESAFPAVLTWILPKDPVEARARV